MEKQPPNRRWQTIKIAANDFNSRLNQVMETQAASGTLFSRLALIHQVAKAIAIEAINRSEEQVENLEIDELTDPPIYGYMPDDEPVIIQFSYEFTPKV